MVGKFLVDRWGCQFKLALYEQQRKVKSKMFLKLGDGWCYKRKMLDGRRNEDEDREGAEGRKRRTNRRGRN